MNNWIGLIVSAIFILGILLTVTLLNHFKYLKGEGSRKFIHIVFCNWWFIAVFFFDSAYWAALVPLAFVFINYASYKYQWLKTMERGGGSEDLGTVYYALSLFILVLLSFSLHQPWLGGYGVLIMGYGDGLAAVAGKYWGKRRFTLNGHAISVLGSLTLLLISLLISAVVLLHYQSLLHLNFATLCGWALILALSATLIEAFSPMGLDNLTLPLTSSLFLYLVVEKKMALTLSPLLILLAFGGILLLLIALHQKMLSKSGTVAALILGGTLLFLGPPTGVFLLLLFFISSSVLSKLSSRITLKRGLLKHLQDLHDKTDQRDHTQVIANGGVAFLCILMWAFTHSELFLYGCVASFAAANADTWASEIGVLSKSTPKWLLKGIPVPRGLSGGVTWLGFVASVAGASLIAAAFYGLHGLAVGYTVHLLVISLIVGLCGILGALADSLIGECLQGKYHNQQTGLPNSLTEKSHDPMTKEPNTLVAGVKWVDNNGVNFISSAFAALSAMAMIGLWIR